MFDWTLKGIAYHALAMPLTQTDWTYVAALPFDTFQAAARDLLRLAVIAALVGIGVAFAAGALIARAPLQAAAAPDERGQADGRTLNCRASRRPP